MRRHQRDIINAAIINNNGNNGGGDDPDALGVVSAADLFPTSDPNPTRGRKLMQSIQVETKSFERKRRCLCC
jgi:hypothetical protein